MDQIIRNDRKRVRDLHAMLGSSNPQEQATARRKLEVLLKRLGKTWNDLPELLHDHAAQAPGTVQRISRPRPFVDGAASVVV
jgi:hypothetical protein